MPTPGNPELEIGNSQLPKWQLRLIQQIVSSMKKNYIHFVTPQVILRSYSILMKMEKQIV
ncbi:MAG: hypothetical protein A3F11_02180 [Gammaproteobacteria bacterium RIFCSPHIGHO2_12_FULL_37_14]|nr:MAG: hypothetical protein A3F11_02180 [Gammaproteobacteria bacterium RIFCSPHIGHO2_12_FULL_37_14]